MGAAPSSGQVHWVVASSVTLAGRRPDVGPVRSIPLASASRSRRPATHTAVPSELVATVESTRFLGVPGVSSRARENSTDFAPRRIA